MPKSIIVPKESAPPLAPFSPGTKANGVVYVSGILPLDAEGKLIGPGDIKEQTRAVINSIQQVLNEAGGSLSDVTMNSIFLKDLEDFSAMNEVYREYFSKEFPARYCIQANLVKPEFLIEISSIAHLNA